MTLTAFVGQTRSKALICQLQGLGIGECTQPTEWPPRRTPWFLDNGAFRAWKHQRPFPEERFTRCLTALVDGSGSLPEFVIAPDIVGGGLDSLRLSMRWLSALIPVAPVYVAVQDGMPITILDTFPREVEGVFVGGTLPWKLATGEHWVRAAHQSERRCHIGRVGTARRVRWAKRIQADSIDSCLPLWSRQNLSRFLSALEPRQVEMFGPANRGSRPMDRKGTVT